MTFNNRENDMGKKRSKTEHEKFSDDKKAAEEMADIAVERGAGEPVEAGEGHPTVDPIETPDRVEQAEKVELDADLMRIRVNVNVNGHHAGDTLVVERTHPFYSAILGQKLAEEIGADD